MSCVEVIFNLEKVSGYVLCIRYYRIRRWRKGMELTMCRVVKV